MKNLKVFSFFTVLLFAFLSWAQILSPTAQELKINFTAEFQIGRAHV